MANALRAAPPGAPQGSDGRTQIDALDGLRAIAALMVLTTHVAFHTALVRRPIVGELTSRFDIGVCLFFFLSGFLLYRPWAGAALAGSPRPSVRRYLRKRVARVVPAYVAVVVVVLGWYPPAATTDLDVWLRYLTFTQVYASGYERPGLTQMWSLSMEVAFYLVLPVIAALAVRRPKAWAPLGRQLVLLGTLVVVGAAYNALRAWGDALPADLAGLWLPAHLSWFAGGMFLAVASCAVAHDPACPQWLHRLASSAQDWQTWLVVALCTFTLALTPLAGPLTPFDPIAAYSSGPWFLLLKELLYGATAFALMVPLTLGGSSVGYARALADQRMRWLGRISYGIFLWHLVLLGWISRILGIPVFNGWFWVLWPATLAATIAVSWLSWHVIERRSIAWGSARPRAGRAATRTRPLQQPATAEP